MEQIYTGFTHALRPPYAPLKVCCCSKSFRRQMHGFSVHVPALFRCLVPWHWQIEQTWNIALSVTVFNVYRRGNAKETHPSMLCCSPTCAYSSWALDSLIHSLHTSFLFTRIAT